MKPINIRQPAQSRSAAPDTKALEQTSAVSLPGNLQATDSPKHGKARSLPDNLRNAIVTKTENNFPRAFTVKRTAGQNIAHTTLKIEAGVTTGPGADSPQDQEKMPRRRAKQERRLAKDQPNRPQAGTRTLNPAPGDIESSENDDGSGLKTGQPGKTAETIPVTKDTADEILASISRCLENMFNRLERRDPENGFHMLQLFCQEIQRYSNGIVADRSHPTMVSSIEMEIVARKSRSYFESRTETGPTIDSAALQHLLAFHKAMKKACYGFEDAPEQRKRLEFAITLTGMILNQAPERDKGHSEALTERQILAVIDATSSETEVVGNNRYRMEELSSNDARVLTRTLMESLRAESNAELHKMIEIGGQKSVLNAVFENDIDRQITVIDGEHLGTVMIKNEIGDRLDVGKRRSLTRADAAIRKCCNDEAKQAQTVMQLCCQNSGTILLKAISSDPSLRGLLQLKDGKIQIDTDRSVLMEWLTGDAPESIMMLGTRSTYNISSKADGSVAVKMTFKDFGFQRVLRVTIDVDEDGSEEEDGLRMSPVDIEPTGSSFRLELEFVVNKNGDIRAGRPPRIHAGGTVTA